MKKQNSILDFFPLEAPRAGQAELLEDFAKSFLGSDVLAIEAPTGSGKTAIAETIASWIGGSFYAVPTNAEVSQIAGKTRFTPPGFPKTKEREDWLKSEFKVGTYHHLLSSKQYAKVQIFDEAHRLIPLLREMDAKKFWPHLFPEDVCQKFLKQTTELGFMSELAKWSASFPRAKKFLAELEKHPDTFLLRHDAAEYRGAFRDVIELLPLVPTKRPILWPPSRVNKIVLLSATLSDSDISDLHLSLNRVRRLKMPSPIPVDRRPCFYDPVGSMGQSQVNNTLPRLVSRIKERLKGNQERGFIHATYELAAKLKEALGDEPRLRWHDKFNRTSAFRSWMSEPTEKGSVFIGSGFEEAVSFDDDLARWQIICKVQFPSQACPAILEKKRQDPAWYAWQAIKALVQSYGRVSRGPEDFGSTEIVDSDFLGLLHGWNHLFPVWFKEALR